MTRYSTRCGRVRRNEARLHLSISFVRPVAGVAQTARRAGARLRRGSCLISEPFLVCKLSINLRHLTRDLLDDLFRVCNGSGHGVVGDILSEGNPFHPHDLHVRYPDETKDAAKVGFLEVE